MNRVEGIKKEIKQLEENMNQLKIELKTIQTNCEHEFQKKDTIQECLKCSLIESLCW
ncbi:hypothetical protein ACFCYN_04035 [Gottfriedia sp. NPDC056225]|uniref:hypothetical protein n=1 Tax=Gottfriedia sp. NPDC056225 TaxID=3345751 RepID=UPI001558F347|nr:hypothetical protein HPK19_14055 [Arthrobacter citreus]